MLTFKRVVTGKIFPVYQNIFGVPLARSKGLQSNSSRAYSYVGIFSTIFTSFNRPLEDTFVIEFFLGVLTSKIFSDTGCFNKMYPILLFNFEKP